MKNKAQLVKLAIIAAVLGLTPGIASKAAAKPLKVFILAGQSNMQGHVNVSTLDSMADDPRTAPILKEMRGTDGKPRVCEKVWISSVGCAGNGWSDCIEQKGKLTTGFGASASEIGPEFTFGIYMEKLLDEPILIIKTAWGGKSLITDFRPPSAGKRVFNEFIKEQWKNRFKLNVEKEAAKNNERCGVSYRLMIEHVRKVLADIKRVVPGYDPQQGYELAGFVWFQGFNDMIDDWSYRNRDQPGGYGEYGQLMAQFIRDVRKDLKAPQMPFVIGVMGIGGDKGVKPSMSNFRLAQASPASLPEFKGNVAAVPTAPFWDDDLETLRARMDAAWPKVDARVREESKTDPKADSGENKMKIMAEYFTPEEWKRVQGISNHGYHYLGAAKIMAPIGKAFAEAMAKQMGKTITEAALVKPGPANVGLLRVKGGRFLTLNTVIRVNQIEATRDVNKGSDEANRHTPETVAAFRNAVSKGIPGAKVTWAFSWRALHDERANYSAIRRQVVGYHKTYGDEITFIPGGYFAPMYSSRAQVNRDIKERSRKYGIWLERATNPRALWAVSWRPRICATSPKRRASMSARVRSGVSTA